MSTKLDLLIAEAKAEQPAAVRDLDWEKLEARLMTEVQSTPMDVPASNVVSLTGLRSPEWRKKYLRPATIALALAATVIIYVRRDAAEQQTEARSQQHAQRVLAQREEASSLTSGDLRIDDAPLAPGQVVRTGDALSVTGGRAVLQRANAVSWLIETDSPEAARARVSAAGQQGGDAPSKPLVLDLEHGSIEAQVTPVKSGEAFAVDVITKTGIVRVAVHGTHLRVSRAGDRVVVDLTEGVIAIGNPPTGGGVTTGTTVTAPAHVELDATDLGSLEVKHTDVRPPVQLGDHVVAFTPTPSPETDEPAPIAATPAPKPSSKLDDPKPTPLPPREAIAAAIHACAAKHANHASEVRVTVTSSLELTVGPDGTPTLAQFTPPLPPAVQACAAETIYKTKLDEPGKVSLPISFTY